MKFSKISPYRIYMDVECAKIRTSDGKILERWIQKNGVAWLNEHTYPDWMPLKLHLALERCVEATATLACGSLLSRIVYHFVHGMICGYPLRKILIFIEQVVYDQTKHWRRSKK